MGPLTLCDFIGLDVLYAVCDSLYEEFKRPEYAPPPLLKRMVVSGHHGRKTGRRLSTSTSATPVAAAPREPEGCPGDLPALGRKTQANGSIRCVASRPARAADP